MYFASVRFARFSAFALGGAFVFPQTGFAADWYTGAPSAAPTPTPVVLEGPISQGVRGWNSDGAGWGSGGGSSRYVGGSSGYTGGSWSGKPKFGAAIDATATADTLGSKFGSLIATIAPFSALNETGLRVRVGGVFGSYYYIGANGLGRVNGTQRDGSFMVGYEWVSQRLTVGIYGGANINENTLSKADPNNLSAGRAYGAKVAMDFYYTPSNMTMMSGVGSYSSAHSAYYARLKAGWRIAKDVYVGPEFIALGDNFFSQYRVGAHITGARLGFLQFGASAGFLSDRVRGTGLYGILDARASF